MDRYRNDYTLGLNCALVTAACVVQRAMGSGNRSKDETMNRVCIVAYICHDLLAKVQIPIQ
jgi:hypothetical protein